MRILHAAEAFGGGLYEMVKTLAEGTAEHGHRVGIAYGVRPETPEDLRERIDPSVDLFPTAWTRRTPRAQWDAARELRRLVSSYRPDVVHLHSSFSGVVGAAILRRTAPTVFTPHAFASVLPGQHRAVSFTYAFGERFACRRVTVVGAVSPSEAATARRRARARRVVVIENGIVELDGQRLVHRSSPSAPRVVAMGRTVAQRQPEACARILSVLRDVAEVEWIGGAGGSRGDSGRKALVQAGIPPTGWLPRETVLERLGRASAYLHWTAWDGHPLSVLEAMAMDVLVVASDIPPNRDILGPEQVCGTEEEAVALLRRLLLEPDFAGRLLAAQRARRPAYSAERMVAEWLELYERLGRDASATPPFYAHAAGLSRRRYAAPSARVTRRAR